MVCVCLENMEDEFHVHICSSDSMLYFPSNKGSDFRVNLDEKILFSGQWSVALVGLTVGTKKSVQLDSLQLYLCSNLVDFSFVGGKKVQLLRKVCLGQGFAQREKRLYNVETVENYCFYKSVIVQECLTIHICVLEHDMNFLSILDNCNVTVSLHFKRSSP